MISIPEYCDHWFYGVYVFLSWLSSKKRNAALDRWRIVFKMGRPCDCLYYEQNHVRNFGRGCLLLGFELVEEGVGTRGMETLGD